MKQLTDDVVEAALEETGLKLVPGITYNGPMNRACVLGVCTAAATEEPGPWPIHRMATILEIDPAFAYGAVCGFDGSDRYTEDRFDDPRDKQIHDAGYNFGKRWRDSLNLPKYP